MLAALPTLILARRDRSTRPSWTLAGFDGLALGWLVLGAAALHVRYWPGYIQGMADLVVTPLLLTRWCAVLPRMRRRRRVPRPSSPGVCSPRSSVPRRVDRRSRHRGRRTAPAGRPPLFAQSTAALPGAHALLGPGPPGAAWDEARCGAAAPIAIGASR
ncbi:MAG: hypothetical protein R2838_19520 [Caldilineaceae bacterium]